MFSLSFNLKPVKAYPRTWTVDDDGPADFHTIQEAINNGNDGDMIRVKEGTYSENLVVNKSISLFGENRENTIVDGNAGNVFYISVSNTNINGFKIQNGIHGFYLHNCNNSVISNTKLSNNGGGIYLYSCSGNSINDNWIEDTVGSTIFLSNSYGNTINGNIISRRGGYGVYLFFSSDNTIRSNKIYEGFEFAGNGIELEHSEHNTITDNTISNNGGSGLCLESSHVNNIYHNNIVDNRIQVYIYESTNNLWDNGYPSGGNYRSDYGGVDNFKGPSQDILGSDGIGDTPYVIDTNNQDNYPLMKPHNDLKIKSSPFVGVVFTIGGTSETTPYCDWVSEGSYRIEMPETFDGYVWSHWLEDGDTNRIKIIEVLADPTWTGVYTLASPPAPPVGGEWVPVDKLGLMAPWVCSATLTLAIAASFALVQRRKKRQD
jgi:parallel beta-helix repeat protein